MTLLPFVMTIILVLSLYAATLFKTHTHFVIEKEIYLAQYEGDRAVRNLLVENEYEAKKKRTPRKEGERKAKVYLRPTENFSDKSKLNLSRLNHPPILEAARALVKQLYKEAPFKVDPNLLLAEVQEKMKKTNDFAVLFPYKMVKGTVGSYPPITDYFYINKNRPGIYFRHASPAVIKAYFGEKMAKKIFDLETPSTLTEEELGHLTSKWGEELSFKISTDRRTKESYKTPLTRVVRQKKSK